MGDMCICVGPPDTIVLGSMGVFIGGKPAARMGDQCAHGGAITLGLPTVLIGESGAGGMAKAVMAMPISSMISILKSVPKSLGKILEQGVALTKAADNGSPFCEECEKAKANL
jgi:hypothetical protein